MAKEKEKKDNCSWLKAAAIFVSGAAAGVAAAVYAEDVVEYVGDIIDSDVIEIPEQ